MKFPSLNIVVAVRVSASPCLHQYVCLIFRAGDDDTQAPLRVEPKTLAPSAQDDLCVSISRWDWLLQEKQQLQVSW